MRVSNSPPLDYETNALPTAPTEPRLPEMGFEPMPLTRPELESGALDHSAIQALFCWLENPGFDPGASSLLTTHSTD